MADDSLVELNVSGVHYTSTVKTLTNQPDSLLAKWFTPGTAESTSLRKDAKVRHFITSSSSSSSFITGDRSRCNLFIIISLLIHPDLSTFHLLLLNKLNFLYLFHLQLYGYSG